MFEQETKEITEKLIRTLKLYQQAKRLHRKINTLEWGKGTEREIFYTGFDLKNEWYIYEQANNKLKGLIQDSVSYYYSGINIDTTGNKKTYKENLKKLNSYTNDDILSSLKHYLKPNEYDKQSKVFISENTVEIKLSECFIGLLLNCLNIFANGTIEEKSIRDKAAKALKNSNTFIYRNIKITVYKNGKTKLVFENKELKEKFLQFTSDISEQKTKQAV